MISIGHETCLFNVLSKFPHPETLGNIAKTSYSINAMLKSGLDIFMEVGKIIEYDNETQSYYQSFEYSEYLTR